MTTVAIPVETAEQPGTLIFWGHLAGRNVASFRPYMPLLICLVLLPHAHVGVWWQFFGLRWELILCILVFFFFTSITSHASLSEYAVLGYLLCTRSSGWKDGYDQDEYDSYRFLKTIQLKMDMQVLWEYEKGRSWFWLWQIGGSFIELVTFAYSGRMNRFGDTDWGHRSQFWILRR